MQQFKRKQRNTPRQISLNNRRMRGNMFFRPPLRVASREGENSDNPIDIMKTVNVVNKFIGLETRLKNLTSSFLLNTHRKWYYIVKKHSHILFLRFTTRANRCSRGRLGGPIAVPMAGLGDRALQLGQAKRTECFI